ncbi:MAG: Hsp20/alpha crystallin family protein [Candidatus Omnitrophica bacterium]|nr:Hsp20/alpha crystallin family protein [Candidatus Omnitrophota bacterium]
MEKIQRDFNRLLDASIPGKGDHDVSLLDGYWSPAVDVVETKDSVVVKVDLPGLKKDDIDVSIENNVLTIRGEKKHDVEHREGDVLRAERYFGSFYRAFTLPSSVDAQKVNAKFENGVLELSVLKKEEAKPKQIKIDVK